MLTKADGRRPFECMQLCHQEHRPLSVRARVNDRRELPSSACSKMPGAGRPQYPPNPALPDGQITPQAGPVCEAKIFCFCSHANQFITAAVPPGKRGVAHVTNARWDAVDAMATTDERDLLRTAKSCGPGAPVLAPSFVGQVLRSDGGVRYSDCSVSVKAHFPFRRHSTQSRTGCRLSRSRSR
jgi:hypothetical protein